MLKLGLLKNKIYLKKGKQSVACYNDSKQTLRTNNLLNLIVAKNYKKCTK